MNEGGEPFRWETLVPHIVHPVKVPIIEALQWIRRPLSASLIEHMVSDEFSISNISYHMRALASVGVLTLVGTRQVRGATEKFFILA